MSAQSSHCTTKGSLHREIEAAQFKSAFRFKSPLFHSRAPPIMQKKGGAIDSTQTIVRSGPTRKKGQQVMHTCTQESEIAVFCLLFVLAFHVRGSCVDHSHSHVADRLCGNYQGCCNCLPETFPMRAQQQQQKTVWYRIVRMVDLQKLESQGGQMDAFG